MPNVIVTNANLSPISILGLGPVAPNATKSGYLEEAVFAPHAKAYRTKGANIGLVVQEVGQAAPDNTQSVTTTSTQLAGKKVILLDSTGGTFVHTLLAASAVAAGTKAIFLNTGSANQATLTAAGADHIGDASATTYALTTSVRRVVLTSNGVDRWTTGS